MLRDYESVMGLNRRNYLISRSNPASSIRLVNDKQRTKTALQAAGAPVAPTLHLIDSRIRLRALNIDGWPSEWALKPNQSLGGTGIMLAVGSHERGGWRTGSGRHLSVLAVKDHVRLILDGEFSPRAADAALVEPLIHAHPDLDRLAHRGLSDVRVICIRDEPVLAMLRLPTAASGGRANLHQKAIGAAVDLGTGQVVRAWCLGKSVSTHPDTQQPLLGATVPHWSQILRAAARCAAATGLHYLGADIVVDKDTGPVILEVNARPGLQIQNVAGRGLLDVIEPGGH